MSRTFHNAVLTGACGGFGQALARQLLGAGCQLALVGLNRPVLDALALTAPGRCAIYTPDVSDAAAMQAMAADWLARHGPPDLVIANAGVAGGFDTAQADDLAVMRRMLEINLLGAATTFQPFLAAAGARPTQPQGAWAAEGVDSENGPQRGQFLPDSQAHSSAMGQEAGEKWTAAAHLQPTSFLPPRALALVGVASVAGWRGLPGNGAYCASKAGLIAYLQSLRAELRGTQATVHTVSPGYLRTPLTAGNRFAMPGLLEPDDAARRLLAGVAAGREHIVLPRRTGWLARALGLLPARAHDALLLRQPRKPRVGQAGATPIPGLNPTDPNRHP